MRWLFFPTTLFEPAFYQQEPYSISEAFFLEEPSLIYDPVWRPYRVNRHKIAFFRASMKAYAAYWESQGIPVHYISYVQALRCVPDFFTGMMAWDPCDHILTQKYSPFVSFVANSPSFILDEKELTAIHTQRMPAVYKACKTKLNLLVDIPSQDADNRKSFPADGKIPPNPTYHSCLETASFYQEAILYAQDSSFEAHIGDPACLVYSPITHQSASRHLDFFIAQRFDSFGPFQDAIVPEETHLFHAFISHLLNVGLLTPLQVIERIRPLQDRIPLASYEGFVRQILGWREYMRYLYIQKTEWILEPFRSKKKGKDGQTQQGSDTFCMTMSQSQETCIQVSIDLETNHAKDALSPHTCLKAENADLRQEPSQDPERYKQERKIDCKIDHKQHASNSLEACSGRHDDFDPIDETQMVLGHPIRAEGTRHPGLMAGCDSNLQKHFEKEAGIQHIPCNERRDGENCHTQAQPICTIQKQGELFHQQAQNPHGLSHAELSSISTCRINPLHVLMDTYHPGENRPQNKLNSYSFQSHAQASSLMKSWQTFVPFDLSSTWNTGGALPLLDQEIMKAQTWGYAHHIIRLMVFLNLFRLMEIPPQEIYRWFMEVVSLDAYDWVMYPNIAAMGFYSEPPLMQKPYLSTSAYYAKLSGQSKRCALWDSLFYRFLEKNQAHLTGGAALYGRNLATFKKFKPSVQESMRQTADSFLKKIRLIR